MHIMANAPRRYCPKCDSVMVPLYVRRLSDDGDNIKLVKLGYDCGSCQQFWRNYSRKKNKSSKKR